MASPQPINPTIGRVDERGFVRLELPWLNYFQQQIVDTSLTVSFSGDVSGSGTLDGSISLTLGSQVVGVANLEAAVIAAFDAAGTAASEVADHEAASNPHPVYLTQAEGDAAYQPLDADLTALATGPVSDTAWTPADGSGAALSLTVTDADYVRLGGTIIAWADITYPVTADTNNATISGLPVSVGSHGQGFVSYNTSATNVGVIAASSSVTFPAMPGGTLATNANLSGATIRFVAMYQV